MLQIIILSVWALKVKFFVAFMRFVNQAIDDNPIVSQWFPFFVTNFKAAYNHLDETFLKYDLDACTQAVNKADEVRIEALRKLRNTIKWVFTYPESAEKAQAAEELLRVIDLYGGTRIYHQALPAKTASISNMVDDFEQRFAAQVATVGVGDLVAALKSAQHEFDEKYMARANCESEVAKGAMAEARKAMTEAYRLFVDAINVKVHEEICAEIIAFMKVMNVEIGRYRVYTGQGQAGSSNGDSDSDSETALIKTATFNFKNGNSQKYRIEVGAPLPDVPNTEGYVWKPEVPEFMPEKNLTFKEVPLVEAEATATFHYLNHTEEEIRQVVGSILTAPANTPGCIWDPAVPATMPAVDTSYYEQQVSQEGDENTGGTPPEDEDPNMPPPGSGGSGFE